MSEQIDETSAKKLDINTSILPHEWTVAEVQRLLKSVPALIREARKQAVTAEEAHEKSKLNTKKAYAMAQVTASAKKETLGLSSAEDRKAWVICQETVQSAEIAEIEAKTKAVIAQSVHAYWENVFAAVRKAANLLEDEYRDQKRQERYGGSSVNGR